MLPDKTLSDIQKIDTTILQEYMQLFLSAHIEHFNLTIPTLSDEEYLRQGRMLSQAESILSILTSANLAREHGNYFNKS